MPPKGYRKRNRKQNIAIPLEPEVIRELDSLSEEFPLPKAAIARAAISWALHNKKVLYYLSKIAVREGYFKR